jgi:phosphatidylethanolamine-binding protein (PEBP) family uncharacterized protein
MRTFTISIALVVGSMPCHAHPPGGDHDDHGPVPTWHDVARHRTLEGWLLTTHGDSITIDLHDGGTATVAITDLDADGQARAHAAAARAHRMHEAAQPSTAAARMASARSAVAASDPWQAEVFRMFGPSVRTRWDADWLYVESDGLPHEPLAVTMMVGIRSWQRQVPLPQDYSGANAWQVPLKPRLADTPVDGRKELRKGAIALAANGIPIFNALNNRGEDSKSIGELDEFGGHCGRGDDYHYHDAPLFLQKVLGPKRPIAFALDGFAIHGLYDAKAKAGSELACPLGSHEPLDQWNGHFCEVPKGQGIDGGTRSYHYHASTTFPYINGGMRGQVKVEGDEIVPQAHARPIRPATSPLRGARITGYKTTGPGAWSLTYTVNGKEGHVNYRLTDAGGVDFEFIAPDGTRTTERYGAKDRRAPRGGGNGARGGGQGDRPRRGQGQGGGDRPPRDGNDRPPRDDGDRPPLRSEDAAAEAPKSDFPFSCPGVGANGMLDAKYTCDGDSLSPPFEWKDLPRGTKSLALTMHHMAPGDDEHVYMVNWDLPAGSKGLKAGEHAGAWGVNTVNRRADYAPPCSQGPGVKTYVATLYALKAAPKLADGDKVTRAELLGAIKDLTLGTATIQLNHARPDDAGGGQPGEDRPRGQGGGKRGKREGGGPSRQDGAADDGKRGPDGQGGGKGGLLQQMTAFHTDFPAHDFDVLLTRPTDRGVTASVQAWKHMEASIEFGKADGGPRTITPAVNIEPGKVGVIELTGLQPGTEYAYRVRAGGTAGDEHRFRTRPAAGTPFTFTIQADSHLDANMDPKVYERTLANALADRPDFHVDLGDTFMTDKRGRDFERTAPQYDAQRWYFSRLCADAPLFMVLGNHDGEKGTAGTKPDDMGPWSFRMRTERFPPPIVGQGGFTGQTGEKDGRTANYYAFEWGDALIVVLDPFDFTTERTRGGRGGGGENRTKESLPPNDSSWGFTLGRAQYDWLADTLAKSKARHKFVFIHHLVGGVGGTEARGGVESAPYFEWGGRNADGSEGFKEHRPGWPMPIHDVLVKNRVSAVFHGHDHLYVHGEKDGVTYQCVPQPGNALGGTRSAQVYGYASGTILGSPGHVRVRVSPDRATVDLVRSALDPSEAGQRREREANGTVVATYDLPAKGGT